MATEDWIELAVFTPIALLILYLIVRLYVAVHRFGRAALKQD